MKELSKGISIGENTLHNIIYGSDEPGTSFEEVQEAKRKAHVQQKQKEAELHRKFQEKQQKERY